MSTHKSLGLSESVKGLYDTTSVTIDAKGRYVKPITGKGSTADMKRLIELAKASKAAKDALKSDTDTASTDTTPRSSPTLLKIPKVLKGSPFAHL